MCVCMYVYTVSMYYMYLCVYVCACIYREREKVVLFLHISFICLGQQIIFLECHIWCSLKANEQLYINNESENI